MFYCAIQPVHPKAKQTSHTGGRPSHTGETFAKRKEALKVVKPDEHPDHKKLAESHDQDPALLKSLEDLYQNLEGDLAMLAKATKSSETLLKKNPPQDGADFAKKVLHGAYAMHG
mmetsp:Transcript_28598/g.72471  ORF Transcript_28598/g.72471 Transcript_28598/m.72471 type:complete len:115 (-) Transcript_28598:48-392(-)